jgi:uncharacterized membrane protein
MATERGKRAGRWAAIGACVLLFAALDAGYIPLIFHFLSIASPMSRVTFLFSAFTGAFVAQFALHAVWCVFAPFRLAARLAMGTGMALMWLGALSLGSLYLSSHNDPTMRIVDDSPSFLAALLGLPVMAIGSQLPLWVAKCWFRWRLVFGPDYADCDRRRTLGIRDMLLFTGVVAASLSAARLSVSLTTTAPPGSFVFVTVAQPIVFAVISLLVTMPVLVATLRARRLMVSLPVLAICYGAVAATIIASVPSPAGVIWQSSWYGGLIATVFACLIGVLLAARCFGVRLVWGRPRDANLGSQISDLKSEITDGESPDLPVSNPSSPSQGGS